MFGFSLLYVKTPIRGPSFYDVKRFLNFFSINAQKFEIVGKRIDVSIFTGVRNVDLETVEIEDKK